MEKRKLPPAAGGLCIGWELLALIWSGGFWGHICWLALDLLILLYNFYILDSVKRICYAGFILAGIGVFYLCFSLFPGKGMMISSFVLDFIIAAEYIRLARDISPRGRLFIGVFKLAGDLFAWLAYMDQSKLVLILGLIVFVMNIFYIGYCLELDSRQNMRGNKRKR